MPYIELFKGRRGTNRKKMKEMNNVYRNML